MELPVSVINGRFKVLDRPNTPPGHCAVCGSVSKPIVDFDMTVDYYGAIMLCVDCIREAFILIGHMYPDLVAPAQVTPLYDGSALDVGTIHEYLAASLTATNALIAVLPDSDLSDEDAEDLHRVDQNNADGASGAVTDSDESAGGKRPYDVPIFTGSGDLFGS
jgi:hypothetical protein